jgi:hypothetical protein
MLRFAVQGTRSALDKSDHRHRRPPRRGGEWPRGRAAKQRNKAPHFQLIDLHSVHCQPGPNYRITNERRSVSGVRTTKRVVDKGPRRRLSTGAPGSPSFTRGFNTGPPAIKLPSECERLIILLLSRHLPAESSQHPISFRTFPCQEADAASRTRCVRNDSRSGQKATYAVQQILAYSITSSVRRRNVSGIVRPSAFAVLRLITSSNFVGCSTGMSPGGVPRNILST